MEEINKLNKTQYCIGCLHSCREFKLIDYKLQHTYFFNLFEEHIIKLCFLCKRIAQHAEAFVQSVQKNQLLLRKSLGDVSIEQACKNVRVPVTLSLALRDQIEIKSTSKAKGKESEATAIKLVQLVCEKIESNETNVIENYLKIELKTEEEELEQSEGMSNAFDDCDAKSEDDIPLTLLRENKQNIRSDKSSCSRVKQTTERRSNKTDNKNEELGIQKVIITVEQCMEERKEQAIKPGYVNSMYKCIDCIKGFNYRPAFDNHMKRHGEDMGTLICHICKTRMKTKEKLSIHTKCHTVRYKCRVCDASGANRSAMMDHYNARHRDHLVPLPCPYCGRIFKRQTSLRRHVKYKHIDIARAICPYCQRSYTDKEVLKAHVMMMHPKEVSAPEQAKKYACEECGMMFRCLTYLRKHSSKHSHKRDFYCIECDRTFKSDEGLKQHLKTTQIHVGSDLPVACDKCEKRFAKKRQLERHMNRVHLDVKPFKCEQCDKAYPSNCSLRVHRRNVHEGYKKPLRYPCKLCDKKFANNAVLKIHLRTHTGERPYQCTMCPAQFTQSASLATHDKLIHRRLTRDGLPK